MKPILKWPGGKRKLAPVVARLFEEAQKQRDVVRYTEPFLGGAAVYLHLQERGLVTADHAPALTDANADLINVYQWTVGNPRELHEELRQLPREDWRERYYEVRDAYNAIRLRKRGAAGAAARLIWLNRHGFNGLYRVNQKGEFNVPVGRYKDPKLPTLPELTAFGEALAPAVSRGALRPISFERVTCDLEDGDFVYCDPPYVGGFTQYAEEGFSDEDQLQLVEPQPLSGGYRPLLPVLVRVLHQDGPGGILVRPALP